MRTSFLLCTRTSRIRRTNKSLLLASPHPLSAPPRWIARAASALCAPSLIDEILRSVIQ